MTRFQLNPVGLMSQLSQLEVTLLQDSASSDLYPIFRSCCLAALNSGVEQDNYEDLFAPYDNFEVKLVRRERGVKIELVNPPSVAFVEGKLIKGVHEHLFAVLRDMLYMTTNNHSEILSKQHLDGQIATHIVFDMLRHADAISTNQKLNMIVCWGGHSLKTHEYKYTKEVGYQLGLRGFNICTGCGPGAMKGPMKGATIGHAKQRNKNGRYLGITEPSIIAAEPPNAIVNELIIMPDIEKRLEAFVRISHGIVIFPGGPGTAEELLYLLGVLLHEKNKEQIIPLVLTGPDTAKEYFQAIDDFVAFTLGKEAQNKYKIIIDNPIAVASYLAEKRQEVKDYRRAQDDSFNFNWTLHIDDDFQMPFSPTHKNISKLNLHFNQEKAELASALRKCFSAIVSGNVKPEGIRLIREKGKFNIDGDKALMIEIDKLLKSFVLQERMKLPGSEYVPCYELSV